MTAAIDRTLGALSEPTRRAVVEALSEGPRRPSVLADALGTSRAAMSRHLRVLREAGIVTERIGERDSRHRVVALRREPFSDLRGWIEEVESFWGDQLAAFAAHAEQVHRETS